MTSMEVDIPVAEFNSRNNNSAAHTSPTNTTVHFNAVTEVKAYAVPSSHGQPTAGPESQRPKHKSRRRARIPPRINMSEDGGVTNGEASPTFNLHQGGKPLSPSKMKKEKDRHSRTGRRGMPKKGNILFFTRID